MILGIGADIVDIRRIERLLKRQRARFETRTFTEAEQKTARRRKAGAAAAYAKRFAAKEACAKALGCGIGAGAGLTEIEVENDARGAPVIRLSGAAKKTLASLTPRGMKARALVTLADEPPYALAWVMIVAEPLKRR